VRKGAGAPLEDLVAGWLEWLTTTHAQRTRKVWEDYTASHWLPFFGSTEKLTEAGCAEYRRQRLGKVLAETVRHELTALRNFVNFCALPEIGAIPEPFKIAGVPKRVTGKAHPVRRRTAADPSSPDEIRRIIELLPEWGGRKGPPLHPWHPPLVFRKRKYKQTLFPIRKRFEFAYLTGLRPGSIDKISVPEHWEPGRTTLQLTDEADKIRWGRELPLEPRALEILAEVAPPQGLIFGWHDYRSHLKAAAAQVLPPERAKRFAGSHLRSMFTTHALEQGKNIMGIQYRVGHKLLSTTARYAKPSFRAALETVGVTPDLKASPQVSGGASEQTPSKTA
jgi:integrase